MIQNKANRVIFNTVVLYIKIIVTTLLSLISVPLIMHALGESDFGLYALLGGVVALLAFLKASMTVSTQRFLSVALGENDMHKMNVIFNTSLVLHVLMGTIIALALEICIPWLFNGFLNIEGERITAAKIIYQFLIITTIIEIVSVPFSGVINAKEDMIVFSILGIAEAVLKLVLAFLLAYCTTDRLIIYGCGMMLIAIASLLVNIIYVLHHYNDFSIRLISGFDKPIFWNILGFTSWNTVGALAVVGHNQGIAVVMNLFGGTTINAAYGVANQVNGAMGYFSNTFRKAINPQLMQSQGMGDNQRLINLSYVASKFSVLVMAVFAMPLIFEMDYILHIWLGNPPAYTLEFAQLILIYSILNQYSAGLMSGIQATGRIMAYQITISIVMLLNIPLSYILLKLGFPPYYCIYGFIGIELISLFTRLLFAKYIVGIQIVDFIKHILLPSIFCLCIASVVTIIPLVFMESSLYRLIMVTFLFLLLYLPLAWYLILNQSERDMFVNLLHYHNHQT